MSKPYDRRFDIQLRQDVKDWAKTAGISEQEALVDVLEQRKGSAESVKKQEREKQLQDIKWAAVDILLATAELCQGQKFVSPTFMLRHDLDGDVMTSCGQA